MIRGKLSNSTPPSPFFSPSNYVHMCGLFLNLTHLDSDLFLRAFLCRHCSPQAPRQITSRFAIAAALGKCEKG